MKNNNWLPGELQEFTCTMDKRLDFALDLLRQRRDFLEKVIKTKEKFLRGAPEGTLRINKVDDRSQYYQRTDPKDKRGVYIPNKKRKLVHQLAQKAADKKTLQVSQKELQYLTRFLDRYPARAESAYENLSEERKKLVLPLEETDENFVRRWQSQEFVTNPLPPMDDSLVTARGEVVRSRAEVILANMAGRMKIPYFYEKPLYLEGERTIYPDLTALNVRERREKYVEYFGLMNMSEYATKAVRKINNYERNGIHLGDGLIAIFEAEGAPLDTELMKSLLQRHFL